MTSNLTLFNRFLHGNMSSNSLNSDNGVLSLFCFFLKAMCVLGVYWDIKNKIFNSHSMPLTVKKMSRRIVQRFSRKTPPTLSEPIVWSLRHNSKREVLSHRKI